MNRSFLVKSLKLLLNFFKRKGFIILPLAGVLYLTIFWYAPDILAYLEKKYQQKFVFFTITEPLISLLKFSLTLFIILLFPVFYFGLLSILDSFLSLKKRFLALFYLLGILFFYGGILFAYFITLPYGIKFLISFKTETLEPSIALYHFVNFFSFFLLAFGFIFELPLLLSLLTLLKILKPNKVTKYRKEIFFFIVVFSAIITPTPDAINMSLLALPLYGLFEFGLFLGRFLEKTNILSEDILKEPQQE
ncbi:preprotein translocase subunit TatC [Caldimicrobium thiodismutans]|uniref:Sec-independent protein translocase protein TatC n=1 Tax=Caldimicrobium thiodismutans TaxID=1653476 RepID=A0A0U4W0A2_9BACT|nr:twin-arginine translocase subunit TatC [Caldimicrobium thiodismutans]BAU22602.1 preprotein translocase subunit TatC [Caldimicrobium thiodismutans]